MTRCQLHKKPYASKVNLSKGMKGVVSKGTVVKFISYFTVIQTKTYICHLSTLPKSISDKNVSKKALISLQNRFLDVEISFRHTFSYSDLNVCPLAIPEPFAYK